MKTSKIKIMHIITALSGGGAEKMMLDLAQTTNKDEYDVYILVLFGGGELEFRLKTSGIPYYIVGRSGYLGLGTMYQVYKKMRDWKPNIVHTHLFSAFVRGYIVAKLVHIKHIVHTIQNVHLKNDLIRKFLRYFISMRSDKIIVVSDAVLNEYINIFHVNKTKLEKINNGISVNEFMVQKPKFFSNEVLTLGVAGRLEEQKGYEVLFRSLAKCKIPIKLKIAGDGTRKEKLQKMAKELGIDKQVEFLGWVEDMNSFLASIDIFVLPSLWEGFGIVLLEAGLAGKPIVASNIDGICDILIHRVTATLVESQNEEALRDGILWVNDNRKLAREMALQAQEAISQKFDLGKIVSQYEKLYKNLMV